MIEKRHDGAKRPSDNLRQNTPPTLMDSSATVKMLKVNSLKLIYVFMYRQISNIKYLIDEDIFKRKTREKRLDEGQY